MYFNYKKYYSVVLMALADSRYRFVFIDIESYGKDCDASIYKKIQSMAVNRKKHPTTTGRQVSIRNAKSKSSILLRGR
jgi:hypothetical protein